MSSISPSLSQCFCCASLISTAKPVSDGYWLLMVIQDLFVFTSHAKTVGVYTAYTMRSEGQLMQCLNDVHTQHLHSDSADPFLIFSGCLAQTLTVASSLDHFLAHFLQSRSPCTNVITSLILKWGSDSYQLIFTPPPQIFLKRRGPKIVPWGTPQAILVFLKMIISYIDQPN